ncbi:primosome assembly protein PriA, partial [Streptomyces sp. SID14478]|nr:primosome assembly protein PriA [Streptomyces sp. SID14478]
EALGEGQHALLTADAGQQRRYEEWLAVRRGAVRAVVGTRAAMFAPVRDLGLVVVWDDGDSHHSDDHAPFPHVREVLELRATRDTCAFLLG